MPNRMSVFSGRSLKFLAADSGAAPRPPTGWPKMEPPTKRNTTTRRMMRILQRDGEDVERSSYERYGRLWARLAPTLTQFYSPATARNWSRHSEQPVDLAASWPADARRPAARCSRAAAEPNGDVSLAR